jgi:hypothetical protein
MSHAGGTNKYKCKGSPFGDCCSSSGYCGDTTAHCQTGCQSQFGTCSATPTTSKPSSPTGVSTDGTCGGSKGLKCQGSSFGNCCSSGGYCGNTVQHCAQGWYVSDHSIESISPNSKIVRNHSQALVLQQTSPLLTETAALEKAGTPVQTVLSMANAALPEASAGEYLSL